MVTQQIQPNKKFAACFFFFFSSKLFFLFFQLSTKRLNRVHFVHHGACTGLHVENGIRAWLLKTPFMCLFNMSKYNTSSDCFPNYELNGQPAYSQDKFFWTNWILINTKSFCLCECFINKLSNIVSSSINVAHPFQTESPYWASSYLPSLPFVTYH